MSKLAPENRVPDQYDKARITDIFRDIAAQVNQHSEGKLSGRYSARTTVPSGTAETFALGDLVWDSAPTAVGGQVRLGWVCTAPGTPGTFEEVRVANSGIASSGMSAFSQLAASTVAPAATEYVPVGSGANTVANKVLVSDFYKSVNNLTEDTAPDLTADYLVSYDPSASASKKLLMRRASAPLTTFIATTSGTSISFSVPAGVTEIGLGFLAVSTTSTSPLLIQIGNGGAVTAAGYVSAAGTRGAESGQTAGFLATNVNVAAGNYHGLYTLKLVDVANNRWAGSGITFGTSNNQPQFCAGSIAVGAAIDTVVVTTVAGNQTLDNGGVGATFRF